MKSKCERCGTECHPQEADIIEQGMKGLAKVVEASPLTKIGGAIGQRIMGKNGESIGKFCGASWFASWFGSFKSIYCRVKIQVLLSHVWQPMGRRDL